MSSVYPFQSILVHWFLECRCSLLPSPVWPLPICLDSWTWHSRFLCNIALTASDLASITSHIHNWVLFLLWLHPFILSGVISPLISSSILGTYWPGEFIFQCPIFLPFILFMGLSRQKICSSLPLPSSVDHILSDLSTMACLSWVAPPAWLSFIELDKAVVHVIRLASCLWSCFQSVCPPMPSLSAYCLIQSSSNRSLIKVTNISTSKK